MMGLETTNLAWEDFATCVLPGMGKAEIPQIEQCKISFYVGAITVFSALIEGSRKNLDSIAGGASLESIRDDLAAFVDSHQELIRKQQPIACPVCRENVEPDQSEAIEPDNVAVCLGCMSFLTFAEDRQLHVMTDDEIAELPDWQRNEMILSRKSQERTP